MDIDDMTKFVWIFLIWIFIPLDAIILYRFKDFDNILRNFSILLFIEVTFLLFAYRWIKKKKWI
ncbi:MAG: hypothetical protein J7L10_04010 [Methanomicrobia archaeon]|nr:hypothetical protein [Methanomicrobia archaeon]